jgi:hypothetical protein
MCDLSTNSNLSYADMSGTSAQEDEKLHLLEIVQFFFFNSLWS